MHFNAQIKFDNLTAARGLAALFIVLYHAIGSFGPTHLVNTMFSFGYIAVDLFFVMSGFIIAYSTKGTFDRITLKNSSNFILKRIARIYPNHALVILLYLLLLFAYTILKPNSPPPEKLELSSLIYFLTLTNNILYDKLDWNGPSWSISAEFLAYIAFPYIYFCLTRLHGKFMWLVCLASITALAAVYYFNGFHSIGDGITSIGIYRCLFEFICGCTIYFSGQRISRAFLASLIILVVVGLATYILFTFNVILITSIMVLITYFMTTQSIKLAFTTKSLAPASQALNFLGEISYSLYIIHFFVKDVIKVLANELFLTSWFSLILYLAASISTAIIIYRYFEIPTRQFLYRKINILFEKR